MYENVLLSKHNRSHNSFEMFPCRRTPILSNGGRVVLSFVVVSTLETESYRSILLNFNEVVLKPRFRLVPFNCIDEITGPERELETGRFN